MFPLPHARVEGGARSGAQKRVGVLFFVGGKFHFTLQEAAYLSHTCIKEKGGPGKQSTGSVICGQNVLGEGLLASRDGVCIAVRTT